MHQCDGLSWGRIATITGLPCSSIRRTWPAPRRLGNNGQRLWFKGYKDVKSISADVSSDLGIPARLISPGLISPDPRIERG